MYFATQNESAENVLVVKDDELGLLVERETLKIIDKENNSDIQKYNNDWVPENKTKAKCFLKLKEYHAAINDKYEMEVVADIIRIFEMSLGTDNAVCFIFQ